MIEWIDCTDSSRVSAIAYDEEAERILVRFPDGTEWQYLGCPPAVWEEFVAIQTSKGTFIHEHLNQHPHGRLLD